MTARQISDFPPVLANRLQASSAEIAALCDRWRIQELALFGSVIGHDFGPESDIAAISELDAAKKSSYSQD
jgi:predicted nucleotidyltransferase